MIFLSHPAVNAYTRNIARALLEAGMLDEFCTTLAWGEGGFCLRQAPETLRREWTRREVERGVAEKVHRHGWREAARLMSSRLGWDWLGRHEKGLLSVDAVYQAHDRHAAKRLGSRDGLTAVYCGEDSALETFRAAQKRGLKCLYDLPIGYWEAARRLFDEEKELMPEFASTLQGREESTQKLERKREEAQLADQIVVCSEFVASTLRQSGFDNSKIVVNPYGGPVPKEPRLPTQRDVQRPLKLLFAGSIGQRKGIGYLLKAMQQLHGGRVELTLMGRFVGDRAIFRPYEHLFRHEPPRAHSAVLELMREHDVLVLPSLFEGFALVVLEAMACGMAVVVTPNTGAEGIVRDGIDGFFVPIRSSDAITQKIEWMLNNRQAVQQMGIHAAESAAEHGWERFRRGIQRVVENA
jgi:glycosyltransferase involved in cell wall biosynthesis